jgi:hypothetical protein
MLASAHERRLETESEVMADQGVVGAAIQADNLQPLTRIVRHAGLRADLTGETIERAPPLP